MADDGSWSTDFRLSGGPIYSQKENRDIMLEKEVLKYNGYDAKNRDLTEVYFLFKNTRNKQVTVDAGFPVMFSNRIKAKGNKYYISLDLFYPNNLLRK
ncbi:MAG: hypothetical protein GY754_07455 [bacterium]|nr:hypothetical protein [bacterium]